MMANYAEIDGLPVIDNKKIARDLLRDQMEFEGMLTSDGAAVLKSYNYFKVADSYYEAGLLAKKAGCDTEIPVGASFRNLPNYVKSGELDEALLDESVRRILTIKFKRGLFENPYCEIEKLEEALMNTEKEKVSRKIAQESLVLLKNDGILPLKKGTKVAVIGPHADSLRYPVSGYTYPAYIEMMDAARKKNADVSFNGIIDEQAKAEAEEKTPKGPFDEQECPKDRCSGADTDGQSDQKHTQDNRFHGSFLPPSRKRKNFSMLMMSCQPEQAVVVICL